jgi:chromosome segregation ATPase
MPSLKDIWRSGFGRLRFGRRRKQLLTAIEKVHSDRPALFISLAQEAWRNGVVGPEFGRTAVELQDHLKGLEKATAARTAGAEEVQQARENLTKAERAYRQRIEEASKPFRDEQASFDRLQRQVNKLKQEKAGLEHKISLLRESAHKLEIKIGGIESSNSGESDLERLRSDLERIRLDSEESRRRLEKLTSDEIPSLRPDYERVKKDLEEKRNRVEELKKEASGTMGALREACEKALGAQVERERGVRALEDALQPLFHQLGEELNGRRVMHRALSEHYLRLDNQMKRLRELHASLGSVKADIDKLNPVAIRTFWGIAAGICVLICFLVVLAAIILIR